MEVRYREVSGRTNDVLFVWAADGVKQAKGEIDPYHPPVFELQPLAQDSIAPRKAGALSLRTIVIATSSLRISSAAQLSDSTS